MGGDLKKAPAPWPRPAHRPEECSCNPDTSKRVAWAARARGGRQPVFHDPECLSRIGPCLWIKTAYGFATVAPMDLIRE